VSFLITEAFVKSFRDGLTHRAQQMESRIRGLVRVESGISGTEESYDHVGKRRPTRRESRHADTNLSDTPHDRRWVELYVYDDADLIDKPDKVRTLTDPTNAYSQAIAQGFGRLIDEIVMDAAGDSAKTGVAGADSEALGSDQKKAVGGEGMSLAKILWAKRTLDGAEEGDDRTWAVTARQVDDMLNIAEIKSSDYNVDKALAKGRLNSYAGFNWVRVESPILKLNAGSDRITYAWCKESLLLGIGSDIESDIGIRRDKNNSTQVFYSCDLGAVRMSDTGVVQVICDEP